MEIAKNITLGIALFWGFWQFLSLRHSITNGEGIIPAAIPSLLLYIICIIVVLIFHLSPFHLIWLGVVAFFLGVPLTMFPPILGLSIAFIALLGMSSNVDEDEGEMTKPIKSSNSLKKGKGFGNV